MYKLILLFLFTLILLESRSDSDETWRCSGSPDAPSTSMSVPTRCIGTRGQLRLCLLCLLTSRCGMGLYGTAVGGGGIIESHERRDESHTATHCSCTKPANKHMCLTSGHVDSFPPPFSGRFGKYLIGRHYSEPPPLPCAVFAVLKLQYITEQNEAQALI